MTSEFERYGDSDPTTPMFEGLFAQPSDEVRQSSDEVRQAFDEVRQSTGEMPEPTEEMPQPKAAPPMAQATTIPSAAGSIVAPPAPPPLPLQTLPPQPPSPHPPQMQSPGSQPPQPRPVGGGPSTPNYLPPGTPVPPPPVDPSSLRNFTPSSPPKPPDGPGNKPGGDGRLSRWGWRSLVAFLAGGLIAAAGFAAGEFNDDVTASAGGTTPTSMVVRTEDPGTAEAPASLVARVLGPSVVQIRTDFGLGSGVIYRDGYILTNNHVVEDAELLSVRLSTGETFDAELVGSDASKDLAVLSVGERDLPVADLALDSKVQVGQVAVAIGSPFDLQQTVTAGIVSAVNRPVPSRTPRVYVAMIQTDAPINPGNSGGALANRNGELVGINASIRTDGTSNSNVGIGFAVPANRVAKLLETVP